MIESNRIFTKNSNLPHGHGELKLNQFEPFPKNPPISKVFRELVMRMNSALVNEE